MVFTTKASDATTLSPTNISNAVAGTERELVVTLNGTGYNPKLFDYEITTTVQGPKDGRPGTCIVPGTNIIILDPEETNFPITVKVTWRNNPNITTNLTVGNS